MTQNVAKFHWSTNEYRYIFWDRLIMRVYGCGNLYLIFRKLKWRDDHYPVSFLNTEENSFYAPSQFISLFYLLTPPFSYHLKCSSPTQIHCFRNQASNSILPFSPHLGYRSCLTQISLYHNQRYFSLR